MIVRANLAAQHGVTMIELVATITIIAIATTSLMVAVSALTSRSADPMIQEQAAAIAHAYLEEISQAAFCDPQYDPDGNPSTGCRDECITSACSGGCGGNNFSPEAGRAVYDDVCDYAGLTDVGARDRSATAVAGLSAYNVSVNVVDSGATLGQPALRADSGEILRVDVTVTHPGLPASLVLSSYRANIR